MIEPVGTTRIRSFDRTAMRAAREQKAWSRGRLAAMLGVSPAAVANWERGTTTPEPPRLRVLAEALEIDPSALITQTRENWTLSEHRVVTGLHQADVAEKTGILSARLSSLELGYEAPRADELDALAVTYAATADELAQAWQRGRDRLLSD